MSKFFLQNETAGYVGNSPVFWRDGGSGYTHQIDEAKQFDEEEADGIIKSTAGSHRWKKWPIEQIMSVARLTVDMQDLR